MDVNKSKRLIKAHLSHLNSIIVLEVWFFTKKTKEPYKQDRWTNAGVGVSE